MDNKSYPRVQIIINADSNADIQESIGWLSGAVHQSATEWPSESPIVKVLDEKPKNIKAKGTPPKDSIAEKSTKEAADKPIDKKETTSEKNDTISLEEMQKKMRGALKVGDTGEIRERVKALLKEFEVSKLSELSEDKYSDFNKRLDALIGGD